MHGHGSPPPWEHDRPLAWATTDLTYAYPANRSRAVEGVDLLVEAADCMALLGPNGSGKSTLLRLLVGTARPLGGSVALGEVPLAAWPRRALARSVAVLSQSEEFTFPLTVRELVAMGRYPHVGALRPLGRADRAAIDAALERCDVARFADRDIATLSGGERQRARLARALAQEPRALALDEPTLALDIRHEMEIFELVRDLSRSGVTVLLVTHNLNLAARYADRIALLDGGRLVCAGTPAEVIRRDVIRMVYRWPVEITPFHGSVRDAGAPQVSPLAREDEAPRGRA